MRNWKELPKRHGIYALDTVLDFGKFKGKSIQYIVEKQPNYICWLHRDKVVDLDRTVYTEFSILYNATLENCAEGLEDIHKDIEPREHA